MKVIVFGATGFIGSAVAEAFARAGHITYGTSRSSASAPELAKNEIVPLICDPVTDEGKKVWGPIASTADVGELLDVRAAGHNADTKSSIVLPSRAPRTP